MLCSRKKRRQRDQASGHGVPLAVVSMAKGKKGQCSWAACRRERDWARGGLLFSRPREGSKILGPWGVAGLGGGLLFFGPLEGEMAGGLREGSSGASLCGTSAEAFGPFGGAPIARPRVGEIVVRSLAVEKLWAICSRTAKAASSPPCSAAWARL
ncbi:hypothetical protein M9H77_21341 [Catharanthus roseus]|uniref:Uncharacterized protein n=1 Tax=Catharanthus roseus TaxID=4058 RepID=A0ACC0ARD7_CATRO|nr:hypothetical protein M9H77_21341 [Catharanthus roseus]